MSESSPDLPPEILDLIVDHLHDKPDALKACCIVSKSWIPRARTHLFAYVELDSRSIQRWKRRFPDPPTSPAHYARTLRFINFQTFGLTTPAFTHSFCRVADLQVATGMMGPDNCVSLGLLHGLSPTLKSLALYYEKLPLSEILSLICSFPLLENLALRHPRPIGDTNGWDTPSTSPKLTGTLRLYDSGGPFITRGLLSLPNGLHFSKIVLRRPVEVAEATMELVSKCSDTLESLSLEYLWSGMSSLVSVFI